VRVAEERHEESGRLCDVIADGIEDEFARGSESRLTDFGKFRVFIHELVVKELEGLSDRERRRRVVALRSYLEAGYSVNTPAGAANLAEIPAALL
jgi:rRNA-processing protein FCF1